MPRRGPSKSVAETAQPTSGDGAADVDVQLGAIIKSLRSAQKMSQTELGDRIGVSFQQVQKYERGSNRVSASTLMLMARAFGVSASEILQVCEAAAQPCGESAFPSNPLEQELLKGFRGIASTGRRRVIVDLINEIAGSAP